MSDHQISSPSTIKKYAPWDDWDPHEYLVDYFSSVRQDEDETLKFLVGALKQEVRADVPKSLDFGAGPTVVHAAVTVPYTKEIHLSDYLEGNLFEAQRWIDNDPGAFDWTPFLRRIVELEEGKVQPSAVENRARALRGSITRKLRCDASLEAPLVGSDVKYPLLISTYCVDSATSSREVWFAYMKNLLSLVDQGGLVLLAALRGCKYYRVGSHFYPSANIYEQDLAAALRHNGFGADVQVKVADVPECREDGYSSIVFAMGRREW